MKRPNLDLKEKAKRSVPLRRLLHRSPKGLSRAQMNQMVRLALQRDVEGALAWIWRSEQIRREMVPFLSQVEELNGMLQNWKTIRVPHDAG